MGTIKVLVEVDNRSDAEAISEFAGKTVSGAVQDDQGLKILFTDGSKIILNARFNDRDLPEIRVETDVVLGEVSCGPTEAAPFLPVTRQVHPLMKSLLDGVPVEGTREEVLDASDPADDEIFEPVDEEEMDFQDYDDETLDKMGR